MGSIGSLVLLDCRKFKCENNKKGKCALDRVTLTDDGSHLIKQIICVEAKEREESKQGSEDGRRQDAKTENNAI